MREQIARLLLVMVLLAPPSSAYTGGPIRAELAGYDSTRAMVYFRLRAFDEAWCPPEVYCFALDSESPQRAVRDTSLEQEDRADWESHPNAGWMSLLPRLVPLVQRDFEPALGVSADSVGTDPDYSVTRYEMKIRLAHGDTVGEITTLAFCRGTVVVEGAYGIPGRGELLVVVTYVGRQYGCESVAQPVILKAP